jgi:hypothetical protein
MVYGIRPTRTFQQAALKYSAEHQHKKTLERDVYAFDRIMPHIGHLALDRIHNDTLAAYRRVRCEFQFRRRSVVGIDHGNTASTRDYPNPQ